jgi:uncharacterized protein YbjQ (UPF0145 family)
MSDRMCNTCSETTMEGVWTGDICPICKSVSADAPTQGTMSRSRSMIMITDAQIAGKAIKTTLGMVRGSTVRAKHVGSDLMAGLKNVVGGELTGYTELLTNGRDEALRRMEQDAASMGADAIISVRLTTSVITAGAVEVMAYGTAVKLEHVY